jgi:hypothetical protein
METEYLDPNNTIIETAPDGTLRSVVEGDRCGLRLEAMRAFPLSYPRRYIVLRDGAGKEIGIIENLDALPPAPRKLIEEQLHRRYFLPRVTAINFVVERFGSAQWELETDRGRRSVATGMMNEAVSEIEPGRYLITDVENNRYEIASLAELDPESQARFLGKS